MKRSLLLSTNQQFDYQHNSLDDGNGLVRSSIMPNQSTLDLIVKLCQALEEEGISYCHWKSNNALEHSASGDNDLDLLIGHAHAKPFTEIVYKLGFTQAEAPPEKRMPGVLDYYGYDSNSDKFVHVHAHFQLIVGHDLTKNYCLPIENAYLESANSRGLFKVPAPELEFILFVIRMILKHSTWDTMLIKHGRLSSAEREEFAFLQDQIDVDRMNEILLQHFSYISLNLFGRCLKALKPDCSILERIKVGQKLQNALKAYTRRPQFRDIYTKFWRRLKSGYQRRFLKHKPKRRLMAGGVIIAIVGGDGAGKSTLVNSLYSWLSKDFDTIKLHLGRPNWSFTTIFVRGILSIGRLLGFYPHLNSSILYSHDIQSSVSSGVYPYILTAVCRARDRYLTYVKAKRFSINGGLVICDRFPLSQIKLMDGPAIEQVINTDKAGRMSNYLISLENNYYKSIIPPEMLFVLRVNPDIAVQRKTDENPLGVKIRSTDVWEIDWRGTQAYIIDGHRSPSDIQSEIKSLIWSKL